MNVQQCVHSLSLSQSSNFVMVETAEVVLINLKTFSKRDIQQAILCAEDFLE